MQTRTPNGALLKVAFKHDHFTDPKQGRKRGRAVTLCYITLHTDFGAASVIGEGMSRCAWEDRSIFTKEEGRRRALRKATEDMDPVLRGLAMKAYFERHHKIERPCCPHGKDVAKFGPCGWCEKDGV